MIVHDKPDRDFTIIRNEVMERMDISLAAKGLWAFLMTKPEGWQTTVRGLAVQLKEGKDAIATALKELEAVGLYHKVKSRRADGTYYWADYVYGTPRSVEDSPRPENPDVDEPRLAPSPQVNTNKVNTDEVSTDNNSTNVELAKAGGQPYGNTEINQAFDYWQVVVGYQITSKVQANRRACNNLLKRHGAEAVGRFVDGVAAAQRDRYAPRISDFCDLQSNLSKLIAWGRQNVSGKVRVIS